MRRSLLLLTLLAACGGDDAATPDARVFDAELDATPAIDANPEMPGSLRETGLYADWDDETLADDVHAFSPEYVLWSDGATKRRWIYLPPGTTIDTSDMDYWRFPEGTKLWKEFTRDGVRVETRLLQKIGPEDADWYMVAFAWNEAQDEALAAPLGVTDALGTDHNIPSKSDCVKCHTRQPSRPLGFSAIQLDHDAITGELALADVIALSWLSDPPDNGGVGEYFPLPGATLDQQALGYLHANCGGCHNAMTDISTVNLRLRLEVGGLASVAATTTGTTAINVAPTLGSLGGTAIFEPNDTAESEAYLRFTTDQQALVMPPYYGHELIDPAGQQLLADWIATLPP